jgi:hypothetical protein
MANSSNVHAATAFVDVNVVVVAVVASDDDFWMWCGE